MGMAASQARFLGLTARQNNIEFEGQQINQQRTMLANQSANYYSDLLGMSVPVPPSVDSYSKTVYTFNDGALTNTITSLIAQANGHYMISYLSKWQEDYVPVAAGNGVVVNTNTVQIPYSSYMVGTDMLRVLGTDLNPPLGPLFPPEQIAEELQWAQMLNDKYGADTWYVRYVMDTTLGVEKPYFYRKSDLDPAMGAQYDPDTGVSLSNINVYTIGSEEKVVEHTAISDCLFERDSSGRLMNLSIPIPGSIPVEYTTYALTTETTTDQDAYNDAMNNYEYEKYLYDQAIENINSKIAIIQAQDKNLELRLKQLDTERNAVMTEKDAVSKVIENNVKDSFKTFSA